MGTVRIWDTVNTEEHPLKLEVRCLSGPVADIAWSPDNQRLIVVGEGSEKFGHCFIVDTGTSVGEIGGHQKAINSCDFKPSRPFRVVTCGEDNLVGLHEGPPFKFKQSMKDHTRFANCIRYSPNGEKFISVGSDMKAFIFEGKTGEKVGELKSGDGHKGSIYSIAWKDDNTQCITSSADKTVKLWDVETSTVVSTFTFADKPTAEDMQVGCAWRGDYMLSLSLSGDLNYLDVNNPSKPTRIVKGHQAAVSALAVDRDNQTFFSGDSNGRVRHWTLDSGSELGPIGSGHGNKVVGLVAGGGNFRSAGLDDTVRQGSAAEFAADSTGTGGSPVGLSGKGDSGLTATARSGANCAVLLHRDGKVTAELAVKYTPLSVSLNPSETQVAVGGDDSKIHLYTVDGDTLADKGTLEKHRQRVTAVVYSPNGEYLASGCGGREIFVWNTSSGEVAIQGWVYHTAAITTLAWSPDSEHLASGSVDSQVYVWNTEAPTTRIHIKDAHKLGVNTLAFADNNTLLSGGQDGVIRTWKVTY
eukprot:TRINITY_DN2585_c1_g1_i6.p1 TRINITY_DN2585_c1_g1~~TRINITY_DN2585_c1_g1_i6.p1  ORF type:complete len:528 (-),score=175.77 TRINITY_DN2585_c1_g1_i6:386-1969(-)